MVHFFCSMLQGDIRTECVNGKAILMVGQSRIGKSTGWNHLSGLKLIGKQDEEDPNNIVYRVVTKNMSHAQIGDDPDKSVTTIPNVGQVKINGQLVKILDMAGFTDKGRGHEGTFIVSYMLKRSLELAKEIKFILVIDHPTMALKTVEPIVKNFVNLIEMFNITYLEEELSKEQEDDYKELRRSMISSIALMVTRSEKDKSFYVNTLNKVKSNITKKGNKTSQDNFLLDIITEIIEKEKVVLFKQAQIDEPAEEPKAIQYLENTESWGFINTGKRKAKKIFKLPFERQFQQLTDEDDKKKYLATFQKKVKYFKSLTIIFKQIMERLQSNWNSNTDIQDLIEKLQELVQQHNQYQDVYLTYDKDQEKIQKRDFQYFLKYLKIENFTDLGTPAIGLELLGFMDNFYSTNYQFIDTGLNGTESESQTMLNLSYLARTSHELMRTALFTEIKYQKIFIEATFLAVRGLEEISSIYQIDQHSAELSRININQYYQELCFQKISEIRASCLQSYQPNSAKIDLFEEKLKNFLNSEADLKDLNNPQKIQKLRGRACDIYIKKCKFNLDKGNYEKCIQDGIQGLESIHTFEKSLAEDKVEKLSSSVSCKRQLLLQFIGCALEDLDNHEDAITVYNAMKAVHLQDKCYSRMAESETDLKKKFKAYCSYGNFLECHGRWEKALELYQMMIDSFILMPKSLSEIKQRARDCTEKNANESLKEYLNNLALDKKLVHDEALIECLRKIKNKDKQYSSTSQSEQKEKDIFEELQELIC